MRRRAALLALVLVAPLAACASAEAGPPTLTWYINPDSGGQARIARECSEASDGAYRLDVALLPRDAPSQREQLVRRLAAADTSIDLMSIDPPFVPEFSNADFLADVPDDVAEVVTQDVAEGAVAAATFGDELVVVPFWANTQLLWYRKAVAEAAGLDMTRPVTWEQVIAAADDQDVTVAVQGTRAESLTVWVNALVESAGGHILENPDEEDPQQVTASLDSDAGRTAAQIIADLTAAGVGGAQLSNADEDINASMFEGDAAGFMVNWPFVWQRAKAAVEAGSLDQSVVDDYGWAMYPQAVEGEQSRPPIGGVTLGVSAFSEHPDLAFEAAQCIVQPEKQAEYYLSDGNPPGALAAFDDPEVQEAFPMADLIRESLQQAAPRPQTPFYNEVSSSLQRTWHPPRAVSPDSSPGRADQLVIDVLQGRSLL
ncbi:extracellular solute-binding protein [Cellulomonas dongxiuzhuiae]|uniref:Extracellular solute-binding protein n=1 Tax=Cellulomonas dongxiuzhuiae TaxID=2819979 RepID=A0ABX8GLX1_9CELL|nr:extracellular solute-binding protein [Cellulomonas dongxiuzhuiae]MBO3088985.1 extracellular solute-binding protein [Cellulomonas dongxiuzhuiae]MBO3096541.1 extracellular solute-binding protein [Cellulomonas dongxiuzhuiae]QWC16930.1 extracellular solute-binding protein [Cellulomonas dongxiuzhuiae]